MNRYRMTATIVGVLFFIGTVSGALSAAIGKPILTAPDYLTRVSANEGQIIIVTLLQFIMGVACAGIGLALYPRLFGQNTDPISASTSGSRKDCP